MKRKLESSQVGASDTTTTLIIARARVLTHGMYCARWNFKTKWDFHPLKVCVFEQRVLENNRVQGMEKSFDFVCVLLFMEFFLYSHNTSNFGFTRSRIFRRKWTPHHQIFVPNKLDFFSGLDTMTKSEHECERGKKPRNRMFRLDNATDGAKTCAQEAKKRNNKKPKIPKMLYFHPSLAQIIHKYKHKHSSKSRLVEILSLLRFFFRFDWIETICSFFHPTSSSHSHFSTTSSAAIDREQKKTAQFAWTKCFFIDIQTPPLTHSHLP